jgi:hypothetical protein
MNQVVAWATLEVLVAPLARSAYQTLGGCPPLLTIWHMAMRPGQCRALDPIGNCTNLLGKAERLKACVRSKVEHPFRVIKQQLRYAKVCSLPKSAPPL